MLSTQEISSIIARVRQQIADGAEGLVFNPDDHTYFYNGRQMTPVSEVCHRFERGFDSEYWARRKAEELGVPVEKVLTDWQKNSERACREGTDVHSYGEWHYYRHTGEPIPSEDILAVDRAVAEGRLPGNDPRLKCIDQFWEYICSVNQGAYRLFPVAAENRIVNPELGYAGTFDLLCLCVAPDDSLGLVIFDYKTNGNLFNIFKRRGCDCDTMLAPIEQMAACNAAIYSCQLSLYQLGLERVVDLPVIARRLLWLDPTGVEAIRENTPQGYERATLRMVTRGLKSKWQYYGYYLEDIDRLKRLYRFATHQTLGILNLPDLTTHMRNALSEE